MEEITLSGMVVTVWETFGWFSVAWVVLFILGLLLLWRSLRKAHRKRLGAFGLFLRGILVMLLAAAIITPFVPMMTMAPFAALHSLIDILSAYAMALLPASLLGMLWVYFGSLRRPPRLERS